MIDDDTTTSRRSDLPPQAHVAEPYDRPEIIDYGTLTELTQSGTAPLTDSFGASSGGS